MTTSPQTPDPAMDMIPAPAPLRIPIFRQIWISSMASNFGGLIQSVGASWMMVSLSGSATLIALVQSSTTLPIMLLALMAGAIADNMDRRLVMLAAQCFMLAVSVALAVCAWLGLLTPWLLLAFTFLIGCGMALHAPAWQASVGDMVPRAVLSSAVTLNAMSFNIARSAGPAIGGMIVATAGAAAAFLTNALSYVGLIVVLARWNPNRPPRMLPRETLGVAMAAGVRYVVMSPALMQVMARAMLFALPATAIPAMMPLIARDLVAGGAVTYGILLGAFGIGAVLGGLASGRLRQRHSTEWIVRFATFNMIAGGSIAALSHFLPMTLAGLLLAGSGWVLALASFNAAVQLGTPRWVVARAVALYQTVTFGGMALGAWSFGLMADEHGVSAALLVAAPVHLVGLALGLFRALPEMASFNMEPIGQWRHPETAFPVELRSGPVVVTLEYRVRPGDAVEFLNAMNERRRIRMRDGARQWTLLRDLADEQLWIERYHVPTWLDYLRHNQRRTHADAQNSEQIRLLHQGDWPPVVNRRIERQTGSMPLPQADREGDLPPSLTDPSRFG